MVEAKQIKRVKSKKAKKVEGTKVILMPQDEISAEEEEEDESGGMYLGKADIQLIYNALREYKPSDEDEEVLHSTLLEGFEEILVVDYQEPFPDVN